MSDTGDTPKRGRGRPTKYNPEIQAQIVDHILHGSYLVVAAGAVGIAPSTLRDWMKHNPDFAAAVHEAERQAEMRMARVLIEAASKDPDHAKWWLERKFHERWGRRDRTETRIRATVEATHGLTPELQALLDGVLARDED